MRAQNDWFTKHPELSECFRQPQRTSGNSRNVHENDCKRRVPLDQLRVVLIYFCRRYWRLRSFCCTGNRALCNCDWPGNGNLEQIQCTDRHGGASDTENCIDLSGKTPPL